MTQEDIILCVLIIRDKLASSQKFKMADSIWKNLCCVRITTANDYSYFTCYRWDAHAFELQVVYSVLGITYRCIRFIAK